MNLRHCINCETTWSSVADEELEGPHICPRCGDELQAAHRVIEIGHRQVHTCMSAPFLIAA